MDVDPYSYKDGVTASGSSVDGDARVSSYDRSSSLKQLTRNDVQGYLTNRKTEDLSDFSKKLKFEPKTLNLVVPA